MNNIEIDALVAEHVMKLDKLRDNAGRLIYLADPQHWDTIPHYSTDMTAAWEVFDKIIVASKYDLGVMRDRSTKDWVVVDVFTGHYKSRATTVPMTICLAALKLKGVEYEVE